MVKILGEGFHANKEKKGYKKEQKMPGGFFHFLVFMV